MFKVNNKDTRTTPMVTFWCLYCYFWRYFTPCSSVTIAKFEHINANLTKFAISDDLHNFPATTTTSNMPEYTAQKVKFSIKDFFSFLRIWSHLLEKSLIEKLQILRSDSDPYFPVKSSILFLYGNIWVKEYLYSGIFWRWNIVRRGFFSFTNFDIS